MIGVGWDGFSVGSSSLSGREIVAHEHQLWRFHWDPRDAIYPNGRSSLSDENVIHFIDKEWSEHRDQFHNVACAAAFSGRVVALRRVLEQHDWPIVYVHYGYLVDDMMNLVMSNWHCTPEQICAMIDLLVEHGADVNRPYKEADGRLVTPLDHANEAIKYLGDGSPLVASMEAARERLLHHGAKMYGEDACTSEDAMPALEEI